MLPILSWCARAKILKLRTARHRAVIVHDLDDHRRRFKSGQARQITARLSMSGAGRARHRAAP